VVENRKEITMPKRILLNRLHAEFVRLIETFTVDNDITQGELAKLVGLQRSHLNALLNGGRALSAYYIHVFIRQGIISVSEIYDGNSESERETEFWEIARESENFKLLAKLARLRGMGIDIEEILERLYPNI